MNIIGAGRENLLSAVNARVAITPVSISFGSVPAGGQMLTFDVTLTSLTSSPASFDVAVRAGGGGIAYSVSTSSLALDAGGAGTVTITMAADRGAESGGHQALLTVSTDGSEIAHAVVFTLVK